MNFECDLYLAPSTIPFLGRGIFSGRMIKANETFHVATTVTMRYSDIQHTMLNNYVFGAGEEGISMAEMGPGENQVNLAVVQPLYLIISFTTELIFSHHNW